MGRRVMRVTIRAGEVIEIIGRVRMIQKKYDSHCKGQRGLFTIEKIDPHSTVRFGKRVANHALTLVSHER